MLNTYLSFHYFWSLLVWVEFHHLNSYLTLLLGFFQSQLHSLLNLHLHWHHNFLLLLLSCLIGEYKCKIDFHFQKIKNLLSKLTRACGKAFFFNNWILITRSSGQKQTTIQIFQSEPAIFILYSCKQGKIIFLIKIQMFS